jgi:biopolymer transport protein ExbD
MIEDIEGLEKIDDFSLLIMIVLVIIIMIAILLLYKWYKTKINRPPSKEELALKGITNIDFSNSKRASYLITKYGYILAKSEKSKEIYKELLNNISKYKYKKDVDEFDEESKKLYKLFIEVVSNE